MADLTHTVDDVPYKAHDRGDGTYAQAVRNDNLGAANIATGQVALSTAAATWIAARATRRRVMLKNLDTAITVYYGPATVTAGNGMELRPGESVDVFTTALIQGIAASGTPTVAYQEEYN